MSVLRRLRAPETSTRLGTHSTRRLSALNLNFVGSFWIDMVHDTSTSSRFADEPRGPLFSFLPRG